MLIEFEDDDFYYEYSPNENPDWNYARNKFFALKRTDSCWSSSLYSVDLEGFTLPNRDYPYQGLLGNFNDQLFKFIDAIGFKLVANNEKVNLEQETVEVSPWKAVYLYKNEDVELKVEYFLTDIRYDNITGGWIKFDLDEDFDEDVDFSLKLLPLLDIRHINSDSPDASEYDVKHGESLKVNVGDKEIIFSDIDEFFPILENTEWKYKLGDGERTDTDDGIKFVEHTKNPCKLGVIDLGEIDQEPIKFGLVCGEDVREIDLMDVKGSTTKEDRRKADKLLKKFKLKDEKAHMYRKMRTITLGKFGKKENNIELPEAGEWWFKDIWFRDLFESMLHNYEFYKELKDEKWFIKLFNWAALFIKDGVMANKPAKNNDLTHNSLDATLLYLLTIVRYYENFDKSKNKQKAKELFKNAVEQFDEKEKLLKCKANHSWIDSKVSNVPTRIPDDWDVNPNSDDFLLPEVNAMWIKVLENYNDLFDKEIDIDLLIEKYKQTFWNDDKNYLYQMVYDDGQRKLKDDTESSVGVVSLDLLFEYFDEEKLSEAWRQVAKTLLVNRKPVKLEDRRMIFGITTMNSNKKVYYNDEQYHEATIWLRDNPYLCAFLEKLGKHRFVEQIKKNMLDHQMSEGAIFYNHELFSLPLGKNPTPTIEAMNPVPVKNPIQLWSHWVPFLDVDVN